MATKTASRPKTASASSSNSRDRSSRLSDRLPNDWKKRIGAYRGLTAAHYKRVMRKLAIFDWMSQDERERTAFVIVEKEALREQGVTIEDDE